MESLTFHITGAQILRPEGWTDAPLGVAEGICTDVRAGRALDLAGFRVVPGIVDAHGDGFERHLARRRGAMLDMEEGVRACAGELAANGITTAMLAQFYSWEGGMRSPEFARQVIAAVAGANPCVVPDLHVQLRFETHMLGDYEAVKTLVAEAGIRHLVFNDHLPHDHLDRGKRPPRLTGTALKSGRNPEAHLALMQALHDASGDVPGAVAHLAADLRGVTLGSHDDRSAQDREFWRGVGAHLSEFPETREAAEAARAGGDAIVLGAPNVTRGGSHNGNVSAEELAHAGLCDALASDYHYPSPRRAALKLVAQGMEFGEAWALISSGPARILGFDDRGEIVPGKRADLVMLDEGGQVAACFCAGRLGFMAGPVAARLF
ncbi:alpha-D-ribose 1-methylphosphonate 5-triphosphate diphosphatase [Poseidonocella pacifica]|uniref:Alpha-D-ribose 1-methylphosphonate 5-triphosphate diphosphatase n=1 Tax=Poseidonocella pacifica TaxID=871651 RepID=A0A1I0X9X9_9RHOB|nr:alpha-D-ribose 1-methylphosphonate 5-triphosphate diphosphatase [Poseidonocella pacifica]SFA97842.1 alpha-D-ribose 1-methylphosphonate 5-triphosphate diphosphatase [Poseidonocella pacifica]